MTVTDDAPFAWRKRGEKPKRGGCLPHNRVDCDECAKRLAQALIKFAGRIPMPLRDALQATWDDAWNLIHDRRQPSMEEAAELETRFQNLLDEFDRRTR